MARAARPSARKSQTQNEREPRRAASSIMATHMMACLLAGVQLSPSDGKSTEMRLSDASMQGPAHVFAVTVMVPWASFLPAGQMLKVWVTDSGHCEASGEKMTTTQPVTAALALARSVAFVGRASLPPRGGRAKTSP